MIINSLKLDKELKDVGIPIHGVSVSGRVDFKDEATKEQKDQAQKILDVHNSYWYYEERIKAYKPISDQLDMMYWDRVNGTDAWFEHIKDVKTRFPK